MRLPNNTIAANFNNGDYAYIEYATWEHVPSFFKGEGEWWIKSPDGCLNALRDHQITIHDDNTISASPSLVFSNGWHGFLNHGVLS
jgi:hypothetical protein